MSPIIALEWKSLKMALESLLKDDDAVAAIEIVDRNTLLVHYAQAPEMKLASAQMDIGKADVLYNGKAGEREVM